MSVTHADREMGSLMSSVRGSEFQINFSLSLITRGMKRLKLDGGGCVWNGKQDHMICDAGS